MAAHPRGSRRHALRREWLALSLVLLALVGWWSSGGALRRLDHLVNDLAMRARALPASSDIVLIAIDDKSIEAIGRWPWRRALHAQALAQISAQQPRAVALDVLFGEPDADYPGDDLLLAQALRQSARTVLPVARRGSQASSSVDAPLPQLRAAAAQLGHVQVAVDEDGVARRLFALEGPAQAPWPHIGTALLCAAGQLRPACRGNAAPAQGPWESLQPRTVTFTGGAPAFVRYSYVDVLKGRLPPQALQGKWVLVGATAVGLGDLFAAPAGLHSERIPGVEWMAHALHAELAGAWVWPAGSSASLLFNLAPVAAALLGMAVLGPLAGLVACALLALGVLAAMALVPALAGWQLAGTPALAGIALAYPLWSWRRLNAAARFLQLQMQSLQEEVPLPAPLPARASLYSDALERRIATVEEASSRLRRLHHFVSASLQHLPSPTLVCDAGGRVLLANVAAQQHFQGRFTPPLTGMEMDRLLGDLVGADDGLALPAQRTWAEGSAAAPAEGRDGQGRDVLLLRQPYLLDGSAIWLVTLVDLSDMRRAQHQRDQALHFISHDVRAPVASIITLLEMHRAFPKRMPQEQLLARIERQAQASLALAQDFVRLAAAQAESYRHEPFDLLHTLHQALEDAWAAAAARQVRLELQSSEEAAPFTGDPGRVQRAVANVLGNALKFSPRGAAVHCTLQAEAGFWCIAIRDQGPGVDPQQQERIFEPFRRLPNQPEAGGAQAGGVGLGLAFVRAVVLRHGGQVRVQSSFGEGAQFELWLPQAGATKKAAPAMGRAPPADL
ncbi:CHASE2 domain-containing protein [Pulveribacter suum]|uniref:CHASE2 domain-containing protein n=1 Tax=Pulveribacter suum TaxID=2116657 RepID=UPI001D04005F|nr:CHASE2 domain-containing protein [Pulveribacter suum]